MPVRGFAPKATKSLDGRNTPETQPAAVPPGGGGTAPLPPPPPQALNVNRSAAPISRDMRAESRRTNRDPPADAGASPVGRLQTQIIIQTIAQSLLAAVDTRGAHEGAISAKRQHLADVHVVVRDERLPAR